MSAPTPRWSFERKYQACLDAPRGRSLLRSGSTVLERPDWYQVTTPSAPTAVCNEVIFSQIDAEALDEVVDREIASSRARNSALKWCVGDWTTPADIGPRLAAKGFRSWEIRGMGCASSLTLDPPTSIRVEQVVPANVDEYVVAMLDGWSLPKYSLETECAEVLRVMRTSPRDVIFLAAKNQGQVVGTSCLAIRGDYGYLVGTQVLPSARGRGVYRALIAERLRALDERNIGYAVTWARQATSAPALERLGFETLFHARCYLLELPT